MAAVHLTAAISYIRELAGRPADEPVPDGHLLRQFASRRDERAFEAQVRGHGPLVWRVCRRGLGHAQDAEDAA